MPELTPSPFHPFPWRKKLLHMETTRAGRTLRRFAIVDAHGLIVMQQYTITEDAELTIDYVLDKLGQPEQWAETKVS